MTCKAKFSYSILIFTALFLGSHFALADLQKPFAKSSLVEQVSHWREDVDNNPQISKSEKNKELGFISQLQNRLLQESSSDITVKNIKSELEFIDKNNKKGANPLFAFNERFVKESIDLIDQLEPTENPITVLKNYLSFASIEHTKSVADFQNTRNYVNHGTSVTADPDDLNEAADTVESKIFSHQDTDNVL